MKSYTTINLQFTNIKSNNYILEMSCILRTKVLPLALLLLEFCSVTCLFADYKRINVKDFVKHEKSNDPSIFVLFDALSDKDIGEMVKNPKFKAFLDKVDGVRNLKKYDPQNSLESSRYSSRSDDSRSDQIQDEEGPFLRKAPDPFSGASSKSSTSTELSDADEIDRFINKTYREAMHDVKYSVDMPKLKTSDSKKDRMIMNSSISNMLEGWLKQDHEQAHKHVYQHLGHIQKVLDMAGDVRQRAHSPPKYLRMGSSCNKGAAKVCIKACKSVLKGVCHDYKCSSGMKSRFKKECGKNCRSKFSS